VQIDEKNIETTRTLSLFLLLDSLTGFSHPFILLFAFAIRSHYFYYDDDYYHTHTPLSMIIIINNNASREQDERASEFLFRSQRKRGGNRFS
jgi:hypothetical protein